MIAYIADPFRARLSFTLKHSRLRSPGGCVYLRRPAELLKEK